ncbi:MAG: hypothetical protein PHF29_05755 [Candidatus Riflebacteria bacterium]|nr:hypothetical protein [Candidatus Riflebacteria bacterium]
MQKGICLASNRCGRVPVLAMLLIAVAFAIGALFFLGSGAAGNQAAYIEDGYNAYVDKDFDTSYKNFLKARDGFSPWLSFYNLFSENILSKEEVDEMIFSLCVSAAYEDFFNLEKSKWVLVAEKEVERFKTLEDSDKKKEYIQIYNTLVGVAELCALYEKEEYEDAFRKLLPLEKEALASDQDFFIFEIRFMIASARAMTEPMILKRARELLFMMTSQLGEDDERTMALWSLMRSGSK